MAGTQQNSKLAMRAFLKTLAGRGLTSFAPGNENTLESVVNVILRVFEVSCASYGCMNCNSFFGEGGKDANGFSLAGHAYSFGETIYNASGAIITADGASGGSDGNGMHKGGNGMTSPYNMKGGDNGSRGANHSIKKWLDDNDRRVNLEPKNIVAMSTADRCIIYTPGRGGSEPTGAASQCNSVNGVGLIPYLRAIRSVATYATTQAKSP
ncbi:hypothetical protein CC78DRAFT_548705 [Lojkania enalia]|uniref:Uncharacterized protein n=1 Tax=Lojkania enalia TaxID=147567 RepID=A0A9P4MVF9_9PLEO|nr:hypothetical protein CC78DRAFT_548705 [Didymosphaeria enalia]